MDDYCEESQNLYKNVTAENLDTEGELDRFRIENKNLKRRSTRGNLINLKNSTLFATESESEIEAEMLEELNRLMELEAQQKCSYKREDALSCSPTPENVKYVNILLPVEISPKGTGSPATHHLFLREGTPQIFQEKNYLKNLFLTHFC